MFVVHPGDTLVITTPGFVSHAQADEIKAAVLKKLPGIADVVVISGVSDAFAYDPGVHHG